MPNPTKEQLKQKVIELKSRIKDEVQKNIDLSERITVLEEKLAKNEQRGREVQKEGRLHFKLGTHSPSVDID